MSELVDVGIYCTACGAQIIGLEVQVDREGVVKGEHVNARDQRAQPFVKLVVYDRGAGAGVSRSEYRHAVCEPFDEQVPVVVMPNDVASLLEHRREAEPKSLLLDKLREFVDNTPLADGSGHAKEQGWQFAVDTYHDWAHLDLRDPLMQDAALMTLVHVRNAMYVNGLWSPEDDVPSRIVFTMLRIFAAERLRGT